MSGNPPSASRQGKDSKGGTRRKRDTVTVYFYYVTDEQAALLTDTGSTRPLEEVKKKSGAELEFDSNPSPVPDRKIVKIQGFQRQIEAAVKILTKKISSKGTLSEQAEQFWIQWVESAFPGLDSRAYFLPPVYFNRVPMTRETFSDQDIMVLSSASRQAGQFNQISTGSSPAVQSSISKPTYVQPSDVRDDAASQRIFVCLQKLFEENRDVMFGMTQLQFGQYLGEPCYAAAANNLHLPSNLSSSLPRNWKEGDFDVLLIHRHYGLVACEVKALGDIVKSLSMSQQDIDNNIRKKLKDAIKQLDKAEAMLSHLVSDIAPGLRITKTIAFPNLTADQCQQAISGDSLLTQDLCRCLGATNPTDIIGLCLCSNQLSDTKTPWDISSDVLRELGNWWQRRVAGAGPDSHMTCDVYKTLIARFCGPATTVTVPCTCPPRLSVKTLGQAVSCTGEFYTALITLYPEQLDLLCMAPSRLFLAGPPGTGKTILLLLMSIEWLRHGHHVYYVSTGSWSCAACSMLYHLSLQIVKNLQSATISPQQLHFLQYDFDDIVGEDPYKAVNDLSLEAIGGSLYVITDEAGPSYVSLFQTFCDKLLAKVPLLHLWASSCHREHAHDSWQVEYLTRPLRSPPTVVREVEQDVDITEHHTIKPYSERGVPDHTDGPPIKRFYHRGQDHSGDGPGSCDKCGRDVASFLHSLRVGAPECASTISASGVSVGPPCLQWRDVFVLYTRDVKDTASMVKTLNEASVPAQLMKDDDIDDVAMARSDVVWVADGHRVRGLERKVIVCLDDDNNTYSRLYAEISGLSRPTCKTSLLV